MAMKQCHPKGLEVEPPRDFGSPPIEGAVVVAVWREARATPVSSTFRFAVLGNYFTADREFFIYKPGYGRPNLEPGSFTACAYVSQKNNMEGIVLALHGKTEEERKQYEEEYGRFSASPFVPVKNPETKLRNLDFSLEYPANATKLGFEWVRPYFQYTVTGLARATTKEERLRAMPSLPVDGEERVPLLLKMINEDCVRLGYKPTGGRGK